NFLDRDLGASTTNNYNEQGRYSDGGYVQELTYNGYRFPAALTSDATITPIYSATGRKRVGTTFKVRVNTIIRSEQSGWDPTDVDEKVPTSDVHMAALRTALMEPGQLLILRLYGLGNPIAVDGNRASA